MGNSLAVRIPNLWSKELGITEDTSIDISIKGNQVIITKKEPYSLQAFLNQMTDENMHLETFDDGLVGNENWTLL